MQWGGLSDQFDMYEKKNGVTLELLKFFKSIKYPICFSTKGEWWVYDDRYIQLFKDADYWNYKFSIINLDENKAKIIEKGVASPEKRLLAMKELSKYKTGGVTLRLRPFIIGYSSFNDEHIELIRRAGEYGATALSTEFFCLEGRAQPHLLQRYKDMSKVMGFDLYDFYKNYSTGQGYYRLNRELKRKYIDQMEEACKKAGMRFYVSDAHFKERSCNGSCCGLGENWNYSRGQMTEALLIAKAKGRVTWSDISKDMEHLKGWFFGICINTKSSESVARKGKTTDMYEYLQRVWNSPNNARSPYKYFGGILYPVGKDENNDVIYEYRAT